MVETQAQRLDRINEDIAYYKEREKAIIQIKTRRILWGKKLDQLLALTPADIWITRLKMDTLDPGEYRWDGKVTFTGFLSHREAAALLAVADAVILPFRAGGGEWNTTIHAAVLQGTFVLTTSSTERGYDETHNVYYAEPDNLTEMRSALDTYARRCAVGSPGVDA